MASLGEVGSYIVFDTCVYENKKSGFSKIIHIDIVEDCNNIWVACISMIGQYTSN